MGSSLEELFAKQPKMNENREFVLQLKSNEYLMPERWFFLKKRAMSPEFFEALLYLECNQQFRVVILVDDANTKVRTTCTTNGLT